MKRQTLQVLLRASPRDGLFKTAIPGVFVARSSEVGRHAKRFWHATLGIVVQGQKEIVLGRQVHALDEMSYTAAPVSLPVSSRIALASKQKPFLALLVEFKPQIINDLMDQIEREPTAQAASSQILFSGELSPPMIDAAERLILLIERPSEALVLGPLVIKELFYHLLVGPKGPALRQFLRAGNRAQRISQAIHRIGTELSREIDVPDLARTANMSRSAFFKYFKLATAMSPIQYQKRLRLLEAKRLIHAEGETVEQSAYRVGYKSASQFNREYSRMFGKSPLRDTVGQVPSTNLNR